ncbi:MAG: hypothetical protein C0424_03300 [Sphingobacteriaceae bacterium]|nr:hypothetical protein [Sphingobacteriaceae bacterium]
MDDFRLSVLLGTKMRAFREENAGKPASQLLNAARKAFGSDAARVLEQLHLAEKAAEKTPSLAARHWLFSTKSYEQCTAEAVARFKAKLLQVDGQSFTDLTAGAGVDAWFVGERASRLQLVEADPLHAAYLSANFAERPHRIWVGTAEEALPLLEGGGVAYLDPDRRPAGRRVYDFNDSRPDVLTLLPQLVQKFDKVWLKTSPMLDLTACLNQLTPHCRSVYALCLGDELKELLFELQPLNAEDAIALEAFQLLPDGRSLRTSAAKTDIQPVLKPAQIAPGDYLFEPHAGIIKLRLGRHLAAQHALSAIGAADFYVGKEAVTDFPGRQFRIRAVLPYKPKQLMIWLKENGIQKAHVSKRDFFLETEAIRKALKLPMGEDARLFFTKNQQGEAVCVVCER